jgi:YYY domain-containing protein
VLLWGAIELIGLLALPVSAFLLSDLPAALPLARVLGLLVAVYPAWILASVHLLPYGRTTIWLGVGVLALAGAAFLRVRQPLTRIGVYLWLGGEIVFTLAYFFAALIRSYAPDVWGTEKPMDMAFVNAANRSDWFPPADPWFSGASINYYYFGQYIVGFLIRLLGLNPTVGFNLGVALFFALSAAAVFSVSASLYLVVTNRTGWRGPTLVGITGVVLAMLVGSLEGLVELIRSHGSLSTFDWVEPSRIIANSANDFPFFSLLLGDLHAHFLAVPFGLFGLAIAIQLMSKGPRLPTATARGVRWLPAGAEVALAALVGGSIYATNSFSTPLSVALVAGGIVMWAHSARRWGAAALWTFAWLVTSVILFLPFIVHFDPPTHGIGLVGEHPSTGRFARDHLLLYGAIAWAFVPAVVNRLRQLRLRAKSLLWIVSIACLAILGAAWIGVGGPFAVVLILAFTWHAVIGEGIDRRERWFWFIVAMGWTLVFVGDFAYVRDTFAGTPNFRFNTVFKFGYQAWFLLAIGAAVAVLSAGHWAGRLARRAWVGGVAVLLAAATVYPVAGSYSRSSGFGPTPTLAGLGWLSARAPSDVQGIHWLSKNLKGEPGVLEAIADDFDARGHGRVSVFTGLPTVIGWVGHEIQWGHQPGRRWDDVHTIYATRDVRTARALLARYRVRYVFVGTLERMDYPSSSLAKFAHLGHRVFSSGRTVIYRVS